ncbi:hypothetical protein [uncultured Brevundimonas sp.]|uniref:hypothetical protein n=1 Tax=uncultured Brevundimonas sp. TaxID=213418 RepID=UPI002633F5E2|nr:hypothetical protein [uncultured Brevundimonas sp.]
MTPIIDSRLAAPETVLGALVWGWSPPAFPGAAVRGQASPIRRPSVIAKPSNQA